MSSLPPSSEGGSSAAALGVDAAADPAMLHLLNLARSGIAVPEAVEAAALEVPGRAMRRSLRALAERIRRGESRMTGTQDGTDPAAEEGGAISDARERFMAAVATGSDGVIGSVGSYLTVHEVIRDMRRQVSRIIFFSLAVILLAVTVGIFVMVFPRAALQDVIEEFEIEISPGIIVAETACFVMLALTVLVCVTIGVAYFARRWPGVGGPAEMLVQRVPLLGRALALIDLAEMSDGMSRMLAVQRSYPEAMGTVGAMTPSAPLQKWLAAGRTAMSQGTALDDVVMRLPLRASLLGALVSSSGPAPDRPAVAWRIAADAYLRDARRHTARAVFILPPFVAIFAGGLAWGVLTLALSRLAVLVGLISGLG